MRFLKRTTFVSAVALLVSFQSSAAEATCRDDRVDLRGDWGQAGFTVEVAQTQRLRAIGLMGREHLPLGQGMLFVYPFAHEPAFWMKNTLIPLDMLFLTTDGRVVFIHENAQPGDLTPVSGGDGVRYVLELNGGLAKKIGITVGSQLKSPFIKQQVAVWPCDEK